MKDVQLRNMVLLGNSLSKLFAHCIQNKRKIQLQNLRLGFDAVAAEANRNVFKKPKKAETNNKKAAEPIGNKTAIKNQMSTVREEEDEEYSPAKTIGIINILNILSKRLFFLKKFKAYDPIETVREYLAPLEKKSMDRYFNLRKTLVDFVKLLEKKKRKKAFEKIHNFKADGVSAQLKAGKKGSEKNVKKAEETPKNPEKTTPIAINNKDKGSFKQKSPDESSELLGKITVEDNLKSRHELEVKLDKKTNQLVINEPGNREIKTKSIAIPKENSPETFFKTHQINVKILIFSLFL